MAAAVYPVTQSFLDKIRADERRVYGKVQIDYTDPYLDQSITVTTSEQANVSYPAQTVDAVTEPYAKFAALDGAWVLGQDWALVPGPDEAELKQMGWWGSQLAGADGSFAQPYPTLTVRHFSRPVRFLKVSGDAKRGEWPVDFTIKLYGPGDVLLHTESVTGNTEIHWNRPLDPYVIDVVKQELIITRWSHAGRQAKILEFFTSISEVYEGDDVILIHLLEEREVSQGSLPVGNISANEIVIRLNNSNRKFDAGYAQSPLYQLLKQNRRIRAWLGVEHDGGTKEWVPLGVFWSGDWSAPEDEVYAQTTGRDKLELLRKSTYSSSQVQINKTLYDLALAVLQDAGLKPEEYWVDTELQQYTVPYAYFEPMTHREALRLIAEACLGQVYCDRNGVIRLESLSFTYRRLNQFLLPFMVAIEGAYITADDYFRKDRPVKWEEIANYIEVETNPLWPVAVAQEVYRSNSPVSIVAGERKTIIAYYNDTPCIEAAARLEGAPSGCIIDSATYYAWGAVVTVYSPTNTGTFTLVIDAKPLRVLNREKAIAQDDASITDNGLIKYTFAANPLIQTLSMAQIIADKLLASFKNPRRDVELEWRGNPCLELGDSVTIKENKGWEQFFVIRQELEYSGALWAKLSARKM